MRVITSLDYRKCIGALRQSLCSSHTVLNSTVVSISRISHKNISNMLLDWADDLRKSATKTRARVYTFDDFSRCFSAEKLTKTCPEVIHSEAFTSLLRLLLTEAKEISAGLWVKWKIMPHDPVRLTKSNFKALHVEWISRIDVEQQNWWNYHSHNFEFSLTLRCVWTWPTLISLLLLLSVRP